MSVTQAQLQKMLKAARDNWDLATADEPFSEMEPTLKGMIGADLSEDQEVIDEYIDGPDDWDGLQNYILIIMARY